MNIFVSKPKWANSTEHKLYRKFNNHAYLKKFDVFYEIDRLITAFTESRHWFLSWAKLIPAHPPSYFWRSVLILFCACVCVFLLLKPKIDLVYHFYARHVLLWAHSPTSTRVYAVDVICRNGVIYNKLYFALWHLSLFQRTLCPQSSGFIL
jgi:hypothetical protein